MNISFTTEVLLCLFAGMFPVIFTFVITNIKRNNEPVKTYNTTATGLDVPIIEEPNVIGPNVIDTNVIDTNTIQSLKEALEEEQEKTRRLQSVVYQMIGKLYDDDRDFQENEIDYLFGDSSNEDASNSDNTNDDDNTNNDDDNNTLEAFTTQIAELQTKVGCLETSTEQYYCGLNELLQRVHELEEKVDVQLRYIYI